MLPFSFHAGERGGRGGQDNEPQLIRYFDVHGDWEGRLLERRKNVPALGQEGGENGKALMFSFVCGGKNDGLLSGGGEKVMHVKDLAGAGVAFVVQYHIVGAHHLFFGAELVGHAGFELGAGGVVAFFKAAQPLFEFKIDADDFVHQPVEAVLIDYRALEQDVGGVGMLRRKTDEVFPHARMYQGVEALQHGGVGEDDAGDGLFVDGAVGTEHPVAKKVTDLHEEIRLVVIGTRHFVGHKTGDAQFAELVEDSGLSAPYSSGESNKQGHFTIRN